MGEANVSVRPFHCEVCQQSFTQSFQLLKHIQRHNGIETAGQINQQLLTEVTIENDSKDKVVLNPNGSESPSKLNARPFQCEFCQQSFSQSFQLLKHIKRHTGIKTDNKNNKRALTEKDNEHKPAFNPDGSESPNKYEPCVAGQPDTGALRKHRIDHSDIKSEKEDIIDPFKQSSSCIKPIEKEADDVAEEYPLKCELCSESLPTLIALQGHFAVSHCNLDSSSNSSEEAFAETMVMEKESPFMEDNTKEMDGSENYPCTCQLCGTGFADYVDLEIHLLKEHPNLHLPGPD
jgi:KRAB domain-containing zinc finger protein